MGRKNECQFSGSVIINGDGDVDGISLPANLTAKVGWFGLRDGGHLADEPGELLQWLVVITAP